MIRADLLAILYVMFSYVVVSFQYGVPCQVWNLIVLIADIAFFFTLNREMSNKVFKTKLSFA